MATDADTGYGNTAWGGPGWQPGQRQPGQRQGGPPWAGAWPPFGGRGLWIAVMILAFIAWWPLGLATLFYLIGSGRMGCGRGRRRGAWDNNGAGWAGPWSGWANWCGGERPAPSSGNAAFDEYRAETLRRLEEEQQEFAAFLERLRVAKDKAEFDAFMAQRRQPPEAPQEPPRA